MVEEEFFGVDNRPEEVLEIVSKIFAWVDWVAVGIFADLGQVAYGGGEFL